MQKWKRAKQPFAVHFDGIAYSMYRVSFASGKAPASQIAYINYFIEILKWWTSPKSNPKYIHQSQAKSSEAKRSEV